MKKTITLVAIALLMGLWVGSSWFRQTIPVASVLENGTIATHVPWCHLEKGEDLNGNEYTTVICENQ